MRPAASLRRLLSHEALDAHMLHASYVSGFAPSQDDVSVFQAICRPSSEHSHALRWFASGQPSCPAHWCSGCERSPGCSVRGHCCW